ncbi:MAG: DUF2268 domain-containing protein [Gemmatimonadaceae bacterium]|jgi:hypothetical protein|nr:DUF2268 domain-containing protein [Gemmatimonadaceae bacterium]
MVINLLPEFLAVLDSSDRVGAYYDYFERHRPLLHAYWDNYVIDPSGPHVEEIVRLTTRADRDDLRATLARFDIVGLAERTEDAVRELVGFGGPLDVVLMVGVGAANAGELVVDGRGTAFVCLEHFTSVQNPTTQGLGLDPELIPMWLAHEIAHAVRYTAPDSRSEMHTLIDDADGYYSYWETGRRASLRELLVNEGLAVHVSRLVSPNHAAWEYFGYQRKQFQRVRELEPMIARVMAHDLDRNGLGLRLRYLSGGMSDDARTLTPDVVMPERAGYYMGAKLVEGSLLARGPAWAVRASASELSVVGDAAPVPNVAGRAR